MFASRLFWKLLLLSSGLTIAATLVVTLVTDAWLTQRAVDHVRDKFDGFTELLLPQAKSSLASTSPLPPELDAELKNAARIAACRLTLVDRTGVLRFDSALADGTPIPPTPNIAKRREVAEAMARGQSWQIRPDGENGDSHFYFARRVMADGKAAGVLRAAIPASSVDDDLRLLRRATGAVAATIALVAVGVSQLLIRRTVKSLRELDAATQAIAKGDFHQRVYMLGSDEVAHLSQSFNHMSESLEVRFRHLISSGSRQATVLGGMVEGVVAIDARERVLFANAAAGRLFGFAPAAVEGRPLIEVIRHHSLVTAVTRALASGQPRSLEIEWEAARNHSLSVQITPLDDVGGAVIVMHDLTTLRRLETIRQDFVANISHELKTPLASIKAYAETLLGGALSDVEHRQRFVERISEQAERLNQLIQDMIQLARIESQDPQFEFRATQVANVVTRVLSDHRALADSKSLDLGPAPNCQPTEIETDEESLRTILANLVDNAVKYTQPGGRVVVSWQQVPGELLLEVTDNGPGISAAELPRVFERFFRVDKARSRELGSTGLGLAIVKHLTRKLGGTVGAESEPGQGSRFWVRLPLNAAQKSD